MGAEMSRKLALVAACIAVTASQAYAASVGEFHQWSETQQAYYVVGFFEEFVSTVLTTDDHEPRRQMSSCLSGLKTCHDRLQGAANPATMASPVSHAYAPFLMSAPLRRKEAK